jgi:hypothetical protein
VHQGNGASYELTVIANHLRSLTGVNDPEDGARIRAKRAAQAKFLAEVIHARQIANPQERIVLLGDFNAFEFNDGYTDSMGVITGREVGPTEVLNYVDGPITTPLTNMAELSPEADRYSFSFDGNAQSLDHMVVNQALLDSTAGVRAEHARINADFGEDNYGDFTVPVRVSDHDPVVLFLSDNAFGSADLAVSVAASSPVAVGNNVQFGIGLANGGPDEAALPTLDFTLNTAVAGVQLQAPAGWNCSTPLVGASTVTAHCAGPAIAAGATRSFVMLVPTNRDLGGRTLVLSARAGTATTDSNTGNNQGAGAALVRANADLAVKVLAPKLPQPIRVPGTFSVGLANGGPDDARNAVLALTVSGGPKKMVTGLSSGTLACTNTGDTASKSTWSCPIAGWYLNGRSDSLNLTVDPAYATSQIISVGAGLNSESGDPVMGNNASAAAVRAVPGLQ